MSLTKRLYRLDEVRAALCFCIKSRRLYEACFWLRELEDSALSGEARRILFLCWFLMYGLSRCSWLFAWAIKSTTPEGRLKLCWQLCRCSERDTSLWWILCAAVVYTDPKEQLSNLFDAWRATYANETVDFWQPLVDASSDEKLDDILQALQEDMGKYTLYGRLTGLVLTHVYKHLPKATWADLSQEEPIELLTYFTEWQEANTKSIRAARVFSIPQSALYGITWRGCGGNTTEELRTINLQTLGKSAYWKQTLANYQNGGVWNSDEHLEDFYDTTFQSCDIPDEWSSADQQKSHGIYPLVGEQAPLWKWWNAWIGDLPHKWIWGKCIESTKDWYKEINLNTTGAILEFIAKLYATTTPSIVPPQKKKEWVLSSPLLDQK